MSRMIDLIRGGTEVFYWSGREPEKNGPPTEALYDFNSFLLESMPQLEIIFADNIAAYLSETEKDHASPTLHDFPCITPPFKLTWIEGTVPGGDGIAISTRHGALVCCADTKDPKDMASVRAGGTISQVALDAYRHHPEARWLVSFVPFVGGRHVVAHQAPCCVAVAEDGSAMGNPIGHVLVPVDDAENETRSMANRLYFQTLLIYATFAFMNCKNITTERVNAPPKVNKKRQKNGKAPLVSYRVLNIGAVTRTLNGAGAKGTGIVKAMHICRGHFKTYTPDKPLLGRHVGTWFWPQTVRGKREAGTVVKDYATAKSVEDTPPHTGDAYLEQRAKALESVTR